MFGNKRAGERIVGLQLSATCVFWSGLNMTGLDRDAVWFFAVVLFLVLECIRLSLKMIADTLIGIREKTPKIQKK